MYRILWDNGNASGALSGEYETEAAAERAGRDWKREMVAIETTAKGRREAREAYSWEVEEVEDEPAPSDEDLDHEEEAEWYEELNRGYSRDRI